MPCVLLEAISKTLEEDTQASKMEEAEEVVGVIFVSGDESSVVLEPSEEPLHPPSVPVAPKRTAILSGGSSSVALVGRDHLNTALGPQSFVQRIAVVGFVADQAVGIVRDEAVLDRLFGESDFMRRSTCDPGGDRKTSAV